MAFEVHCGECCAHFTLPDDLYERKVRGRVVTVRCKKCRGNITVDGVELASRPSNAPLEETPTVPLSRPPTHDAPPLEGLWVVSFGDDDDRELTVEQIQKALDKGEIDAETLVWNLDMDEWLTIQEVPELAVWLPVGDDETGGFLGTGAALKVTEPALRRSSRPPPMPGLEETDFLGDDEVGPFQSVSAGTLFMGGAEASAPAQSAPPTPRSGAEEPARVADAAPEPAKRPSSAAPAGPRRTKSTPNALRAVTSSPPPKPERRLPKAPPKLQPTWMSDAPKLEVHGVEEAELEDEEEAPSSGTPDLRSLTASLAPPNDSDQTSSSDSVGEDIFSLGGGGISDALPTIDVASLPPAAPAADVDDGSEEIEPESSRPRPRKRAAAPETSRAKPPPPPRVAAKRPAAAASRDEPAGGSALTWLLIAGAAVIAGWWFFFRPPERTSGDPPPAPTVTMQPTSTPTVAAPPTDPTPTGVTPSAPDETSRPTVDARKPDEKKPDEKKDEKKPDEKKDEKKPDEKKDEKKPDEKKPDEPAPEGTGGTAPEVAMAPPFDKGAASAALAAAAGQAAGCRKEGDPTGTATVIVTFAPSGRVTTANISGPPFAGTQTGGCIASAMRSAKVPPFSGKAMTVSKTVVIQ